ncbi:MAG TPA: hypothetical protein VK338_01860, partial [Candidatus Nitrosocosmicus sp.]|nr:hypothetical protein [Candidatus Nitrosocosmicus sp.]
RKEKVYNMYSQETQVYMRKNQDELEKIFTNKNKDSILKLLSSDLKDFSSTAFLKKTTNGRPLLIRLSGEVQEIYIYPHQKETMILKLLNGQQDKIPWDEYIYELQGKEVIIPFKDKNGKVLGAIVRAVIE